jgi:hypothetical protein
MKVHSNIDLNGIIAFTIIETEGQNIENLFDKRFNVALELPEKRVMPKDKLKFCSFVDKGKTYSVKSDKMAGNVTVDIKTYYELRLCDKSLEECNKLINHFKLVNMCHGNLKKELKKNFKF